MARPSVHLTRVALLAATIALLGACAPAASPGQVTERAPQSAPADSIDAAHKTITIGIASAFYAFSTADRGLNVGGGGALQELWLQGLVTSGWSTPAPEPRVAAELPSLDRGTMRLEPDGRLTVNWRLRDDVQWADRAPVRRTTSCSATRSVTDERLPFPKSGLGTRLESISAPDDRTLVMVWKEPYYLANAIGTGTGAGLQPLPRHALQESYQAGNAEAFENHTYWTSEFFHIGPYRPVRFEPQVELVLQAVPHYFLGAPRVGNIIVKMFQDTNATYASLLAGALDTTTSNALSTEQALQLKERWESNGEGKLTHRARQLAAHRIPVRARAADRARPARPGRTQGAVLRDRSCRPGRTQ